MATDLPAFEPIGSISFRGLRRVAGRQLHGRRRANAVLSCARIANVSDHTLLSGTASVYVGGEFHIALGCLGSELKEASTVRSVAKFLLSVSRSLRITYYRVTKKLSQSGFYAKSANYVFSQRIIVDVVERTDRGSLNLNHIIDMQESTHDAGAACRARIRGADCAVEALGLDRKLNWVCAVGAQAKINLALE
ncbi:hypothetical protein B0H14DRAFT_2634927 [Mycena olivaceomarginata]|nr:hypothetical protein B0H14DRAFT_2634927 [Mycena olivaceomarginata]